MTIIQLDLFPTQRLDMTVNMKDADEILKVFEKCGVHFAKKFTTINKDGGPSTITFKSLESEDLMKALEEITNLIRSNVIRNVHIRCVNKKPKPATLGQPAS